MLSKAKHLALRSRDSSAAPQNDIATQSLVGRADLSANRKDNFLWIRVEAGEFSLCGILGWNTVEHAHPFPAFGNVLVDRWRQKHGVRKVVDHLEQLSRPPAGK